MTTTDARRAALVAALAAGWLLALGLEPTAHKDSARDMLLARDGLAFGRFEGPDAAFGHFRQGVLWIRLLALTFALGLGPVGQHLILAALLIASVCLVDWSLRRHFGTALDWKPVALFLGLAVLASSYPNLWHPAFAPLGVACLAAALLQVVATGSTAAAAAAGASLALAAEGHPSALLVAPVVVAAVYLSARHPIRGVVAAACCGAVPSLAASATSWAYNGRAFLEQPWQGVMVAAALLLAAVVGPRYRAAWRATPVERRRVRVLVFVVLAVTGQAAIASVLSGRVLFSPQYYLAAVPALAVLAGLAFRRGAGSASGRWAARVATAVVLLLPLSVAWVWRIGLAAGAASMPSYTMHDAERLAAHLWRSGYRFPDVQSRLRGPDAALLVAALAPFAPDPDGARADPPADLRILTFGADALPPGGAPGDASEVSLGHRRRAWLLPLDGWVRLAPARVCFDARDGGHAAVCTEVAHSSIGYHGRYRDLAFPAFEGVHAARSAFLAGARAAGMRTTWELPIAIHGPDAERHVDLVGIIGAPWTIARVEGVGHRGALPARRVVLDRSGARTGRIVLTTETPAWQDLPPDFLETRPGEAALRAAIHRLPPLGRLVCERMGTCPS